MLIDIPVVRIGSRFAGYERTSQHVDGYYNAKNACVRSFHVVARC